MLSPAEIRRRQRLVLRLRRKQKSAAEIAAALGMSLPSVRLVIRQLIEAGLTDDRRGRWRKVSQRHLENQRVQTIIRMTAAGATLQEIGSRLGITRERVRQLRNQIEEQRGAIERRFLTSTEVASELGCSIRHVEKLIRRGELAACRRTFRMLFRRQDVQAYNSRRQRASRASRPV